MALLDQDVDDLAGPVGEPVVEEGAELFEAHVQGAADHSRAARAAAPRACSTVSRSAFATRPTIVGGSSPPAGPPCHWPRSSFRFRVRLVKASSSSAAASRT